MPDSWNTRTSLSRLKPGSSTVDPEFKRLADIHEKVELNLSTIGDDQRHTRIGYKNRMKTQAFELMDHIATSLAIHPSVVDQAKVEFSRYRDVKEAVQDYDGVVASCLALAFQDLSLHADLDMQEATWAATGLALSDRHEPTPAPPNVACVPSGPDDVATTVLHEIRLATWAVDQCRQWLEAVAGAEEAGAAPRRVAATAIATHLEARLAEADDARGNGDAHASSSSSSSSSSAEAARPRTVSVSDRQQRQTAGGGKTDVGASTAKLSMFGTTTMSGRMKKMTAMAKVPADGAGGANTTARYARGVSHTGAARTAHSHLPRIRLMTSR